MVQKIFELQARAPQNRVLQVELGNRHLTLNTFDTATRPSGQLEHFNFSQQDSEDWSRTLQQIQELSTILKEPTPAQSVLVTWENDRVQLIPAPIFRPENLEMYFQYHPQSITDDGSQYKHLSDPASDYQFVYSIPKPIYESIHKLFPQATHQHKQAAITRKLSTFTDNYPLKALLVFYQDHYILTTFAGKDLQLILSRTFQQGTDIVYHVLHAIKEAGYTPDQCCVYLSGMIDGDSTLFKEIYKFVPVIDVDKSDKTALSTGSANAEYPSHFFVPFNKYIQ